MHFQNHPARRCPSLETQGSSNFSQSYTERGSHLGHEPRYPEATTSTTSYFLVQPPQDVSYSPTSHLQTSPSNLEFQLVLKNLTCLPSFHVVITHWAPFADLFAYLAPLLLLLLSRFSRVRLCDPTDGSPPGSSVPGIRQPRTEEWVAISFSNA